MANVVTSVRGKGITLAIKKEIKRKHITRALALEGAKKFRPRLVKNVREHYRNALSEIGKKTTSNFYGPADKPVSRIIRLTTPQLTKATTRLPVWDKLNDRYLENKSWSPGAGVFWQYTGGLARALSSALSVSFGAKHERSVYRGSREGGFYARGLVEYQIRLEPLNPLIDSRVRRSFLTGLVQPMDHFEVYNPIEEGASDDLRKISFLERKGRIRPQLYRPIMGHMAAAYGQLMKKRLEKL